MSTQTTDHRTDTDAFTALVEATADADWSAASPCEDWTARDVLDHVVDAQRAFLTQHGADLGPRPSGSPQEVWAAHRDAVRRVCADRELLATEYDGHFGRTTVGETLATFYGFDLLVHHWDLGQALGHDVTWDDAQLSRIEASLEHFGDALYLDGVCKPAVEVPADASRQRRALARMGRRG